MQWDISIPMRGRVKFGPRNGKRYRQKGMNQPPEHASLGHAHRTSPKAWARTSERRSRQAVKPLLLLSGAVCFKKDNKEKRRIVLGKDLARTALDNVVNFVVAEFAVRLVCPDVWELIPELGQSVTDIV